MKYFILIDIHQLSITSLAKMYSLPDSVYRSPLISMNNIILFDYVIQKESIFTFLQSSYTNIGLAFYKYIKSIGIILIAFGNIFEAFGKYIHELEKIVNNSISLIFHYLLKTDLNYILNILACIGALYLIIVPIVYVTNHLVYLIKNLVKERKKLQEDIRFLKALYIEKNILNEKEHIALCCEVESIKYKVDFFIKNTNREMKKIARELHQFD